MTRKAFARAFDERYRILKPDTFCISFYGWTAVAADRSTACGNVQTRRSISY